MPRERKHPFAEDCKQLVIGQVPAPAKRVCLRWADGASATLERQADVVTIRYHWRDSDVWRVTTQTARLVVDTPHLGGTRFYLACPDCGRRVRKLYDATGGRFLCRHCGGLANRCQSEGAWARALQRAAKLRRYCGGSSDVSAAFPERPKHMRRCVYEALRAEALMLESLPANRMAFRWAQRGAWRETWHDGREQAALVASAKRLG